MLVGVSLLAGCVKPDGCEVFKPILVDSQEDVDAIYELDPWLGDEILAHNMTWERVCNWAP